MDLSSLRFLEMYSLHHLNIFMKHMELFLFIGVIAIILFFIVVSFLFFKGIRKRLLHLQEAMEIRDVDGLPVEIDVKKDGRNRSAPAKL